MKHLILSLALFSLLLASPHTYADSFYEIVNGNRYFCTPEESSGGCHDKPGKETCSAWKKGDYVCVPDFNGPLGGALYGTQERVCRYYDGCGAPESERTEVDVDDFWASKWCKP